MINGIGNALVCNALIESLLSPDYIDTFLISLDLYCLRRCHSTLPESGTGQTGRWFGLPIH